MLHKKVYHANVSRLMEFQHGFITTFSHQSLLTCDKLFDTHPSNIQGFFGLMAYNDPDYNIHPPANHRRKCCCSSSLEAAKKAMPGYMPHHTSPWCTDQGNPTRSGPVNNIIKEVENFYARGKCCPSHKHKHKYKTIATSVHVVEYPVHAFAPRKGRPPVDTSQSGAGAWPFATPGKLGSTSSPAAPRLPPWFTPK